MGAGRGVHSIGETRLGVSTVVPFRCVVAEAIAHCEA
jgi:hypothetical protein